MPNHGSNPEGAGQTLPDADALRGAEAAAEFAEDVADFQCPEHPDSIALWPLLFPVYDLLLFTADVLNGCFPSTERLLRRMANAIRDQMVDAELGLLNAYPERHVAQALQVRAGQVR
jgi:hypothetical protein